MQTNGDNVWYIITKGSADVVKRNTTICVYTFCYCSVYFKGGYREMTNVQQLFIASVEDGKEARTWGDVLMGNISYVKNIARDRLLD